MSRATIEDVARRAGVTKSTVSHALSGKRPVSDETRRRIDDAIDALRYHPNPVARRLAAGSSGAIGFAYPLSEQPDGRSAGALAAVCEAVSQAGYALVLLGQTQSDPASLHPFLESGLLDGIIIGHVQMNDGRVRYVSSGGTPLLVMGRTADNGGLNFVDVEVEAAVEECVEHLAQLDHRRIAFVQEDPAVSAAASRALQAYERACVRRRLRICAPVSRPTCADARHEVEGLLRQQPDVTALIVAGDFAALGARQAAFAQGLRVPDDLSLICLGKAPISDDLAPGVTGIDLRSAEQAEQAVGMLLGLLANAPAVETQVLLEPRWLAGETTARARE